MTTTPSIDVYEDALLKTVSWDIVLGVRWYNIPTLHSIATYQEIQNRHLNILSNNDKKGLIISYADATADRLMFDAGLRDKVETTLKLGNSLLLGMAHIVEGEGFAAASVRSVLSGIQLAIRPDYPICFHSSWISAIPWLEDTLQRASRDDLAKGLSADMLPELTRRSPG